MIDRFNVYVFVVEYFMREAPFDCLVAFFVLQLNYTTFCLEVPLFFGVRMGLIRKLKQYSIDRNHTNGYN